MKRAAMVFELLQILSLVRNEAVFRLEAFCFQMFTNMAL